MDETSWFEHLAVASLIAATIINAIAVSAASCWLW
jgi:hypothetical protein